MSNTKECGNCEDALMVKPEAHDKIAFNAGVKWLCRTCGQTIPPIEELGVDLKDFKCQRCRKLSERTGQCIIKAYDGKLYTPDRCAESWERTDL